MSKHHSCCRQEGVRVESVLEAASKLAIRFFLFQFAVGCIPFLYQNHLLQSEAADLN